MCEHLQYGGFKTPFIFVGSCVLLFALPCTLLVKAQSESSYNGSIYYCKGMVKLFTLQLTPRASILLSKLSSRH